MGGRVLGFGACFEFNYRSEWRRFPGRRPSDPKTELARPSAPASAPAFTVHLSVGARSPVEPSAGFEMTKAYFSPLEKNDAPDWKWRMARARSAFLVSERLCIHSCLLTSISPSLFTDDLSAAEKDPDLNLKGKPWGKQTSNGD